MPFLWSDASNLGQPKNVLRGQLGARAFLGQVKTLAYLNEVRIWAAENSPTAKRLLDTIEKSKTTINLVGMDGGGSAFDNEPGTIFIDLNAKMSVRPGGSTGLHGAWQRLHPYVVFLHEVGHAVQFIENSLQFVNNGKGPVFGCKTGIENAARTRGDRVYKAMKYSERKDLVSQPAITNMAWSVRLEYDNMYRHERPICIEAGLPLRDHYIDIRSD